MKRTSLLCWVVLGVGSCVWPVPAGAQSAPADPLATGFAAPPESARPHTWWHWMNGNVSRTGITLDLEAMQRAGIGGFQLFDVGTGIPKGPVAYGSPEQIQLLQFAAKEAVRLGLEFTLHNCPGWSSSGGPWITPELSMKMLTFTETTVVGGQKVNLTLSPPAAQASFYRDAFVLAFPTPASDARLANWNTKAGYPARGRGPQGGRTAAAPAAPGAGPGSPAIDPAKVIDLTRNLDAQGRLDWDAPAGNWTVLRLGYTTTGAQNKPGPDGGVGLECDKFSRAAMDFHFDHFFGAMFEALKPLAARGLAGALIDSYETGLQNWTDDFPQEFQKRCGYDLRSYLPAMTGRIVGSLNLTERFLWDVRKTQANLMGENYYGRFVELCHRHGLKAYLEPYGPGNFDEMPAGAYADTPMGEFWQDRPSHRSVKLVASVAHVNGRAVVGAESFTSQSRWTEYPYSLKAMGDYMYAQGLNRFIFHRFAMQPNATALPGMTMGPWGGHFDRTNTWFDQGKAWLIYVTRSQFMLQQGLFVADLLYFTGEDSPVHTPERRNLAPAVPPGYDFDTAGSDTIMTRLKIVDGRIVLPDGMTYRVLVQPDKRTMTVDLLRKVHELVAQGMVLVVAGPKPDTTPSLINYPAGDADVRRLARDLWGDLDGKTVTERTFGKGRVCWGQPLAEVLGQLNAKPDFEATTRSGTGEIHALHRRVAATEVYFVANREHHAEDLVCTFNVRDRRPELWDAATGRMTPAPVYDLVDGRVRMPLQLEPSGSVFVVFRSPLPARRLQAVLQDGAPLASVEPFPAQAVAASPAAPAAPTVAGGARPLTQAMPMPQPEDPPAIELAGGVNGGPLAWRNGNYTLRDARGQSSDVRVAGLADPLEITGPWRVTFPPKLGAPAEVTLGRLISWTEHPESGVKYFSGTATYAKRFAVPADATARGKRLYLDLGRVQVLAEVIVNGRNLGILWKLPFRLDITGAVHPGDNDLEIRVTNLWPNRLIGDEQLPAENQYGAAGGRGGGITQMPEWYVRGQPKPDSPRVTFTTWKHYGADSPLLESGLIGPVRLRTAMPVPVDR